MAFQDGCGDWRAYYNGDLLPGPVCVIETLIEAAPQVICA